MQSAYKLNYALNSLVVVTHGSFRPIQIIKCGGFHSRANFAFGKIFLNDIIKVSESFFWRHDTIQIHRLFRRGESLMCTFVCKRNKIVICFAFSCPSILYIIHVHYNKSSNMHNGKFMAQWFYQDIIFL